MPRRNHDDVILSSFRRR